MVHVVRSIVRPERQDLEALAEFSPATIHEAQGRRGAFSSQIKPQAPGMRLCAPAVTASCHPGDNMMLIAAIAVAQPGDVLVVAGGGLTEQGGFGEVLATACKARGLAGFVTDACVRDGSVLRSFGLPVFSAGLSIRGTVKESLGSVNHPIVIGGLNVRPGDVLVGDDDGLVLVACEDIGNAARLSRERDAKEAMMMESLRNGGDVLELTGIGQKLAQKGCTFEA